VGFRLFNIPVPAPDAPRVRPNPLADTKNQMTSLSSAGRMRTRIISLATSRTCGAGSLPVGTKPGFSETRVALDVPPAKDFVVTVAQEDAKAWYDLHAIMSDMLTARAADYDVREPHFLWTPDLERKTGFLAGSSRPQAVGQCTGRRLLSPPESLAVGRLLYRSGGGRRPSRLCDRASTCPAFVRLGGEFPGSGQTGLGYCSAVEADPLVSVEE
jgi:hypothetical protein